MQGPCLYKSYLSDASPQQIDLTHGRQTLLGVSHRFPEVQSLSASIHRRRDPSRPRVRTLRWQPRRLRQPP